jgi:hypothetical protein
MLEDLGDQQSGTYSTTTFKIVSPDEVNVSVLMTLFRFFSLLEILKHEIQKIQKIYKEQKL